MTLRLKGKDTTGKVGAKKSKEREPQLGATIDQSLYSSVVLKKDQNEVSFFGIPVGLWDEAKKKKLTPTETNLWCSCVIMSGQMFTIEGIRFKNNTVETSFREHLMQYAHFFIRIADRDFLVYPYHLMDNYFYFVEKRLTIAILLPEYMNLHVVLRLDKPFHEDVQLTCELMGKLRRSL